MANSENGSTSWGSLVRAQYPPSEPAQLSRFGLVVRVMPVGRAALVRPVHTPVHTRGGLEWLGGLSASFSSPSPDCTLDRSKRRRACTAGRASFTWTWLGGSRRPGGGSRLDSHTFSVGPGRGRAATVPCPTPLLTVRTRSGSAINVRPGRPGPARSQPRSDSRTSTRGREGVQIDEKKGPAGDPRPRPA